LQDNLQRTTKKSNSDSQMIKLTNCQRRKTQSSRLKCRNHSSAACYDNIRVSCWCSWCCDWNVSLHSSVSQCFD